MKTEYILLIIYFAFFSSLSFVLCVIDKIFAIKQKRRISEKTLFLVSILGGSLGMWLGMYLVRHKTKHIKFTFGIPLVIFVQCVAVFLIFFK